MAFFNNRPDPFRWGQRSNAFKPKGPPTFKPPTAKKPSPTGGPNGGAAPAKPVPKPAASPGAPPSSTAPKPPTAQKPEFDKPYYDRLARADERYTGDITQLEGDEAHVKYDFGIDDPTNPFSRVAGLKKAFLQRAKGTTNSLAAGGQLYSGTHQRAQEGVRLDEAEANQRLNDDYRRTLDGIAAARLKLQHGKEDEYTNAFEDFLGRAPEADVPLEDAAGDPAPNQGSQPKGGVLKTPVGGKPGKKPKPNAPRKVVKQIPKKKVKHR